MTLTRRALIKATAGSTLAVVAFAGGASAMTPAADDFRAIVAIDLVGGHDGWNMAVPIDDRHPAYVRGRGSALALPADRLIGIGDCGIALHPAFAPLLRGSAEGPIGVVLNTGPLLGPIDKPLYRSRPDLSPLNVMLHDDAGRHWRSALGGLGPLRSVERDELSVADRRFDVDRHFRSLTSDIAGQLQRVARRIEMRHRLQERRPAFMVAQYGYDTHTDQVADGDPTLGSQAGLYADLALALAAFQRATAGLGLSRNVTAFTVSEFGRAYRGNSRRGTDHGWGNNHIVLGAAATQPVRGAYPDPTLRGPDDVTGDGRWLPSLSVADYLEPIRRWHRGDAAVTA